MPQVLADRVKETSLSTGTGPLVLSGAVPGFQSFAVIGNGNTTYYAIESGSQWEVGVGTYTAAGLLLSRDQILASSNGGLPVNLQSGVKEVFATFPATGVQDLLDQLNASVAAAAASAATAVSARDIAVTVADFPSLAAAQAAFPGTLSEGDTFSYLGAGDLVLRGKIISGIATELVGPYLGADKVGFTQAGLPAAGTVAAKLKAFISVKDAPFNAAGDGATDDTAAIQAAIDAVYAAGGGTLYFPAGIYRVTSLVKNWDAPISIVFQGAGKMATVLRKIGSSTTPIIDFSADVGVLETYSTIADMRILGNAKTHHGLRLTRWARFDLPRIRIDGCDVAIENLGSLVFSVYDPTIQANNIGYRSRLSSGIRPNLVQFFGGNVTGNSTFGGDIGDAAGVQIIGTDFSANGTAGNTATGGIILRSTMDDEFGYALFTMRGVWMEANNGWTFRSEACAGLFIDLDDVTLLSNDSGRAADIGDVFACRMNNVVAGSVGDTVNIAARRSIIHNSIIGVLNDTSARRQHVNVSTTAAEIENAIKARFRGETLANDTVLFGRKDNITGGNANDYEFFHPNALREFWFNVAGGPALRIGANALGFYGTAPQVKQTLAAAATDPATTQTLVNDIRAKLIALGLFS